MKEIEIKKQKLAMPSKTGKIQIPKNNQLFYNKTTGHFNTMSLLYINQLKDISESGEVICKANDFLKEFGFYNKKRGFEYNLEKFLDSYQFSPKIRLNDGTKKTIILEPLYDLAVDRNTKMIRFNVSPKTLTLLEHSQEKGYFTYQDYNDYKLFLEFDNNNVRDFATNIYKYLLNITYLNKDAKTWCVGKERFTFTYSKFKSYFGINSRVWLDNKTKIINFINDNNLAIKIVVEEGYKLLGNGGKIKTWNFLCSANEDRMKEDKDVAIIDFNNKYLKNLTDMSLLYSTLRIQDKTPITSKWTQKAPIYYNENNFINYKNNSCGVLFHKEVIIDIDHCLEQREDIIKFFGKNNLHQKSNKGIHIVLRNDLGLTSQSLQKRNLTITNEKGDSITLERFDVKGLKRGYVKIYNGFEGEVIQNASTFFKFEDLAPKTKEANKTIKYWTPLKLEEFVNRHKTKEHISGFIVMSPIDNDVFVNDKELLKNYMDILESWHKKDKIHTEDYKLAQRKTKEDLLAFETLNNYEELSEEESMIWENF